MISYNIITIGLCNVIMKTLLRHSVFKDTAGSYDFGTSILTAILCSRLMLAPQNANAARETNWPDEFTYFVSHVAHVFFANWQKCSDTTRLQRYKLCLASPTQLLIFFNAFTRRIHGKMIQTFKMSEIFSMVNF